MQKTVRRLVTLLAGTVVAATATGSAANAEAQAPIVSQPFAVTVDNCRSSYSEGVLGWDFGPSIGQVVRVQGVVADDAAGLCAPTTRYTQATFRAYYGTTVVAIQRGRADNAVVPIAFTLAATPTIDRVQVEVCRRDRAEVMVPPLVCTSAYYPRPRNAP